MKYSGLITIVVFLASACAPSANEIQTAIAQTSEAMPTATKTVIPTPTRTKKPTPTKISKVSYTLEIGFCYIYLGPPEGDPKDEGCIPIQTQAVSMDSNEYISLDINMVDVYPYCAFFNASGTLAYAKISTIASQTISCDAPKFRPTPTKDPNRTAVPTFTKGPTVDPSEQQKSDGFYLVGSEIAPGVWRSTGRNDQCYWSVTTRTGDIIENHYGMSGGTMYVPANAFQVELQGCGRW